MHFVYKRQAQRGQLVSSASQPSGIAAVRGRPSQTLAEAAVPASVSRWRFSLTGRPTKRSLDCLTAKKVLPNVLPQSFFLKFIAIISCSVPARRQEEVAPLLSPALFFSEDSYHVFSVSVQLPGQEILHTSDQFLALVSYSLFFSSYSN